MTIDSHCDHKAMVIMMMMMTMKMMIMMMMMMIVVVVVVVVVIIIIIIIIIMAIKGTIRDFLQSPPCAANRLQHVCSSGSGEQITCNTSSAYHVQHVVLRATPYEEAAQL